MPGPLLSSGLKALDKQLKALPDGAKAALIIQGNTEEDGIIIGTAANFGHGWMFSAEVGLKLKEDPSAQFAIGKVWK